MLDSVSRVQARPEWKWGGKARIGVIGGLGEMGSLFSRFFRDRGFPVEVSDRDSRLDNRELVETSDVVLFAAPLHLTVSIISDLVPLLRPDQLAMDLTSLKVGPVREMLRSKASVVGLHPMFGGRVSSLEGQTLVACPVRIDSSDWAYLRELFLQAGIRVKESSPEEHDRMMSVIQVLFHMLTMLSGRVLRDLGVDIGDTLEYTSPSYRLEINILGRMFAQNGALYSAITQMNPYTPEILHHLKNGLESYEKWAEAGDLTAFMEDFRKSAEHLGDFCRNAYTESSDILDFTVRLANRNKEEQ